MQNLKDFHVKDQIAVVTGAARGIGRACALALAEAGAHIAAGLRDIDSDSGLIQEIKKLNREVLPLQMDISDINQIREAVKSAESHFGRIDILVNNAGKAIVNKIEDYTEEDFDAIVNINLKGTYFTSQTVGKIMIRQRSGRIINLSSQAGFIALPTESVYCMTKAGIAHMTKCFAAEWAKYNINVNAVAPTFIKTPGTRPYLADPAFNKSVVDRILLGRVGEVNEVSGAVVFLASPAASMITGATLLIDGGWSIV